MEIEKLAYLRTTNPATPLFVLTYLNQIIDKVNEIVEKVNATD
jgi:hypothetical protein